MKGFGPATFGSAVADIYDDHYREEVSPTPVKLDVLTELADGRAVLDVGCGTGAMAVALAARGLDVTGVDASPDMLDRLRRREGGSRVDHHVVDVTQEPIPGRYGLAYLLFETLLMVGDRAAQRRCLKNVTDALEPGGHLLVEMSVFEIDQWSRHVEGNVRVTSMTTDSVTLGLSRYDAEHRRLDYQEVVIGPDGLRMIPIVMHPCSPRELDEMAAAVGLRRTRHWSDWAGTRFRAGAPHLVAVYTRPT